MIDPARHLELNAFFNEFPGKESSKAAKIIFSLMTLEFPTLPNIMSQTGARRTSIRYTISMIQKPFPLGYSMVVEHTGRKTGFKITSYGIFSEQMINDAIAKFITNYPSEKK